jgi:hypothetical protein
MPYHVGGKGTNGCKGYPVVKEGGEVVGCHATRAEADSQLQALYANVPDAEKADVVGANPSFTIDPKYPGAGIKRPSQGKAGNGTTGSSIRSTYAPRPKKNRGVHNFMGGSDGAIATSGTSMGTKAETLDELEELAKQSPCWDGYVQRGMKPTDNGGMVPNCVPVKKYHDALMMMKADSGYKPTGGMKSAARRALKWKEQGKATGAGTPVGWGRATDIVAGRTLSLDTVKRMYSFFSRHEVDKKGKDFNNTSNPSNGRIMWDAWGGDAGFAWSRAIVEREKKFWQGSVFDR